MVEGSPSMSVVEALTVHLLYGHDVGSPASCLGAGKHSGQTAKLAASYRAFAVSTAPAVGGRCSQFGNPISLLSRLDGRPKALRTTSYRLCMRANEPAKVCSLRCIRIKN